MTFDIERLRRNDELAREARRTRLKAYEAMIEEMPKSTTDPDTLARETYEVFRRALFLDLSTDGGRIRDAAISRDMDRIAKALDQFIEATTNISALGADHIQHELQNRGIEIDTFRQHLAVLGEIADHPKNPTRPGQRKDNNTVAAITAAQYLVDHNISRARAAKIVAAMMTHFPGIAPKPWRVIEQVIRDAGITTKKLAKATRKGFISLTPG